MKKCNIHFLYLPAISQADLIVKYFTKQFLIAKANVSLGGTFQRQSLFILCPCKIWRPFPSGCQGSKHKNVAQNGSAMINSISLYLQSSRSPVPFGRISFVGCEQIVLENYKTFLGWKCFLTSQLYLSVRTLRWAEDNEDRPYRGYMRKHSTGVHSRCFCNERKYKNGQRARNPLNTSHTFSPTPSS